MEFFRMKTDPRPRPHPYFPPAVSLVSLPVLALLMLVFPCNRSRLAAEEPKASGSSPPAVAAEYEKKGHEHWNEILRQPWAQSWSGAALKELRLVEPKPDAKLSANLPPVWHARIEGPDGKSGYLMWDSAGKGGLVEFALDDRLDISAPDAKALHGVTVLQQFPLPGGTAAGESGGVKDAKDSGKTGGAEVQGRLVASGCVPTAGASVLAFWLDHPGTSATKGPARPAEAGKPAVGEEQRRLRDLTVRLRGRIPMMTIADRDGFTDGAMDLAGANPAELAKAIRAEAEGQKLPVEVKFGDFSFETLKAEISAGRPALLSCVVRVPHKPELSWGHEVAAVGWLDLADGTQFAGILDNFFPARHPETVRWIREDAFQSLITVRPRAGG